MNENNVMTDFDLSNVLGNAKTVIDEMAQSSNFNNMKLIYPTDGELRVRLLYSPLAGSGKGMAIRLLHRHSINNSKVPCLDDYGFECDVCRTLNQIQNLTNADLWKYKKTARGIAYAQYVSSNYQNHWGKDNPEPQVGEIVLLMFPWTVYGKINELLVSSPTAANDLLLNPKGTVIEISRYIEDNQVNYEVSTDGSVFVSAPDLNEMKEFIQKVPNLDDAIQSASAPTDKQITAVKNASMNLAVKYGLINPMSQSGVPGAVAGVQTASQAMGATPQQAPQGGYQQAPAQPQGGYQPQMQTQGTTPPWQQSYQPQMQTQGTQSWQQGAPQQAPAAQPQGYQPQGYQQAPAQQSPQQGAQMTSAPQCFGHYDKTSRKCIAQCDYDVQCAMMTQSGN